MHHRSIIGRKKSKAKWNRLLVRRQSLTTRGPENGLSTLFEFWRRILNCKNAHIRIDTLSTAEIWNAAEANFIRPGNITFDRHVFLITKQFRVETVEHFYGTLKELADHGDFENKDVTLIRNMFITNLTDPEIQKDLLKQRVEPRQELELAINMQLRMWNQHQIQQHIKNLIPASVKTFQFSHLDQRIGPSRTTSTKKAITHSSIDWIVVEKGFQTIKISALQGQNM